MSQRFRGKVAVVTGASKGIGAAIAERLGAEGATVLVHYASSRAGADRVVAAIEKHGGRAIAAAADLAKPAEVESLFAGAKRSFGRVDVLVNNAGIYEFGALPEVSEEHYKRQFDLNVLGLLLSTREAAKLMPESGGSVVNVSSVVSSVGLPAAAVYSGTKAAVDAITRSLAAELGPKNIRVNAVNPGMVETEGTRAAGIPESDFRRDVQSKTPLGRIGRVDDIAPAVAFLASEEASWITGETLIIAGGYR